MPFLGAMFGGPGATPESVRPVAEQIRAGMSGVDRRGAAARRSSRRSPTWCAPRACAPGVVEQSLASDPAVSAQGFYDLIVTDLRPDLANIRVPLTVL